MTKEEHVTKCYKCNMGFAYLSGGYETTPPPPQGGLCKVRANGRMDSRRSLSPRRRGPNDGGRNGNDGIHSGASGPANGQCTVIERTLDMRKRSNSHNMSLPIAPFPKGQGVRSGGGGGLKKPFTFGPQVGIIGVDEITIYA
jgi:hypothetical protein